MSLSKIELLQNTFVALWLCLVAIGFAFGIFQGIAGDIYFFYILPITAVIGLVLWITNFAFVVKSKSFGWNFWIGTLLVLSMVLYQFANQVNFVLAVFRVGGRTIY